MSRCAACAAAALRPHLAVRSNASHQLVPTTDRYGEAPDDLVRCSACGHAQVARFPGEGELAAGYEEAEDLTYAEEERGQRVTARATLERIERHAPVGAICDLGCWLGYLLSEADLRGWETVGVEPSSFAAGYARERLGLNVVHGTMEGADLGARRFQAVVMADVIEHLPEPGRALDLASRLLTPGGVVALALPDAGSRLARALGPRWWSVLPTHVQYFTRASMRRLLERHGFEALWMGTAPKTLSVRYYAERLRGYSPALAAGAVRAATIAGVHRRLVTPDFRDRMGVIARPLP